METRAVIQSYRDTDVPDWVQTCMASVAHWAQQAGAEYLFQGDTLLELVPSWYRDKVMPRTPIVADLARLIWIDELLSSGRYDVVTWFDADTLMFDLSNPSLDLMGEADCIFGYEFWLQQDAKGRVRTHRNVHNGFSVFRRGAPALPFLIQVVSRLIDEVDVNFIAPQFVGPKLLTSLHNIVKFNVEPRVGAISPLLAGAVIARETKTLHRYCEVLPTALVGANLCASLSESIDHKTLVTQLQQQGGIEP